MDFHTDGAVAANLKLSGAGQEVRVPLTEVEGWEGY